MGGGGCQGVRGMMVCGDKLRFLEGKERRGKIHKSRDVIIFIMNDSDLLGFSTLDICLNSSTSGEELWSTRPFASFE